MLNPFETAHVLSIFPQIKLSYENITHKKVSHFDYMVAIPEGLKCIVWFTYYNKETCCFLMEISDQKENGILFKSIRKMKNIQNAHDLSYKFGTILYGTFFSLDSKEEFFSIEDILCYKGGFLNRANWGEKLLQINDILKKYLKTATATSPIFGLPIMSASAGVFDRMIADAPYKIGSILYRQHHRVGQSLLIDLSTYRNNTYTPANNRCERVFLVRADIQDDVYYPVDSLMTPLHIPDYKTSVMMNRIFRNIKENTDLDLLEESDDEADFEDDRVDKFVDLNKTHKIVCQYNARFKKWMPIRQCEKNE